jgi:RimJ/RimL family protein N-acetyltransferase
VTDSLAFRRDQARAAARAISFVPVEIEREADEVVRFLSENEWPFHLVSRPSPELVRDWIEVGWFDAVTQARWVIPPGGTRIGILRILPSEHGADLRISGAYRGKGIGTACTAWLADRWFEDPKADRFWLLTREDNMPSRRAAVRLGFVKDAILRQTWATEDGRMLDSLQYTLLRSDWERGQVTPVHWAEPDELLRHAPV